MSYRPANRNVLALNFARRSQGLLCDYPFMHEQENQAMVNQGLQLLPFMLDQECQPGPTWEYPDEGTPIISQYLDPRSMQEWVRSCLSCAEYEGHSPLTGWSPFRSV